MTLTPRPRVLLLGDSLLAGGAWQIWLPEVEIVNAGVPGATTGDVLTRVRPARSYGFPPLDAPSWDGACAVCLLVGTNDLTLRRPQEEIIGNIAGILRALRTEVPAAALLVLSVMPRTSRMSATIQSLNETLRMITTSAGGDWLDLWPALADGDGRLRQEFTTDRLHLTDAGYAAWLGVMRPVLLDLVEPSTAVAVPS